MPLNNSYDEQAVIKAIATALEAFYTNLIEKIDGLNIKKVMKRKNPYLYRAKAMQSASEIVESVMTAFVSSSEETIFGNYFFEELKLLFKDEKELIRYFRIHKKSPEGSSRSPFRAGYLQLCLLQFFIILDIFQDSFNHRFVNAAFFH